MEANDATFYEERHAAVGDKYEARYVPLWQAAAALVPPQARVVELGCGAGRFVGYLNGQPYIGLDFAAALIADARRTNPGVTFGVADLRTDDIPDADCYVALEVLEHVDDDLALLARLPRGARVVLSVPSFHSASHVRHFPDDGSAVARYDAALRIDHEERVALPSGAYFHLLSGTVRYRQKKAAA